MHAAGKEADIDYNDVVMMSSSAIYTGTGLCVFKFGTVYPIIKGNGRGWSWIS